MRGKAVFIAAVLTAALATPAEAAEAPGAPGISSVWATGAKQGLGTSTTTTSKVWYTLGQGIVNEVYYPLADNPNAQDLQYMVTDGATFTDEEKVATNHAVSLADPDSLTYRQVNTAKNGRYRITKTYVTDPARSTLLVNTRFQVLTGEPLKLYALYNPSLGNSGMGDTGATANGHLQASDGNVASALAASTGFSALSNGYSGTPSDGFRDLTANRTLTQQYDSAGTPGNLVQIGQVPVGTDTTFTLALGFGANRAEASNTASASLNGGWAAAASSYQNGWRAYLNSVNAPPSSVTGSGLTQQYKTAVMTIKAHEDKTYRGPSTPQERWEEAGGYSPATIAAEIAALVCAADLATANNDPGAAAFYLQVADSWRSQVDSWTYTTSGSWSWSGSASNGPTTSTSRTRSRSSTRTSASPPRPVTSGTATTTTARRNRRRQAVHRAGHRTAVAGPEW